MDVVLVFNGLGNQMSQYAFYLSKKCYNKNCICIFDPSSMNNHNGSELETIFGIKYGHSFKEKIAIFFLKFIRKQKIKMLFAKLGIRFIYENDNYDYNVKNILPGENVINYFWGGWHSELYFNDIDKKIKSIYKFPKVKDEVFNDYAKCLSEEHSVSIHVRRGDYLDIKSDNKYQLNGVCNLLYYKKAICYFKQKNNFSKFYIFSNDILWCKENFIGESYIFVDINKGKDSWKDMYLMSLCHHHIIANSTFSWWAAWLTPYADSITVRPHAFLKNLVTKDFYPKGWIDADDIAD